MRRSEEAKALDDAEFVALYRRLYPQVVGVLASLTPDRASAEEAASEAFTKAYSDKKRLADVAFRDAWIHRVALNELRMQWRRRRVEHRWRQRQRTLDHVSEPDVHPELWAALEALPTQTRRVVALRYIGDLTQAQIAAVLGIAPGTVASTLNRGRDALAEALGVGRAEEGLHVHNR